MGRIVKIPTTWNLSEEIQHGCKYSRPLTDSSGIRKQLMLQHFLSIATPGKNHLPCIEKAHTTAIEINQAKRTSLMGTQFVRSIGARVQAMIFRPWKQPRLEVLTERKRNRNSISRSNLLQTHGEKQIGIGGCDFNDPKHMIACQQTADITKNNSNGCMCSLAYGTQTSQAALKNSARRYGKAVLSLCVFVRVIESRVLSVCLEERLSNMQA